MLVSTAPFIAGWRVAETRGHVFGLVVRSRGLGGNIMAGLRSIGGGEIHEYTKLLAQAREEALDRMLEEARMRGADAVVGLRFAGCEIATGAAEFLAYGTAVKLR